jgi:uncharacterized protein YdeI (YjbR/CyaY-like superfamily)
MPTKDKRIDTYIAKSADFAKPILTRLRGLIHKACPEVEETLKWGMPSFMYKGILCGFAAFKNHAVFGFWKQKLMKDPNKLFQKPDSAMGSFGCLTDVKQLPPDKVLISYIKEAAKLNEEGVKVPKVRKHPKKPIPMPGYFKTALAKNKKAKETFENFPPSYKRDYLEWLTEAKTEETRKKRLATTIEWLAEGKPRNWKYMRK